MEDGVIFEDDNIKVHVVHPQKYQSHDSIGAIEPSLTEREYWNGEQVENPALNQPFSITLTNHQWAGVFAMLRSLMAFAPEPGMIRLAHDDMYSQVATQFTDPRQHTDGPTEGEK